MVSGSWPAGAPGSGADQVPDAADGRLAAALVGLRSLEDSFAQLCVGPLQVGSSAAAMDLAWSVDLVHQRHVGVLADLRAQLEREVAGDD